ncbi:hypothetical protein Leryth_009738 [Lithospermum erythrorhizon]|nr:hypothetical protein Leryth_009738 [Lithospermum erythrorhizon]
MEKHSQLGLPSCMGTMMKWVFKGFNKRLPLFVVKEPEIEIGCPTDVKHVAHIGWDGSGDNNAPSWMGEFKTGPEYTSSSIEKSKAPKKRRKKHRKSASTSMASTSNSSPRAGGGSRLVLQEEAKLGWRKGQGDEELWVSIMFNGRVPEDLVNSLNASMPLAKTTQWQKALPGYDDTVIPIRMISDPVISGRSPDQFFTNSTVDGIYPDIELVWITGALLWDERFTLAQHYIHRGTRPYQASPHRVPPLEGLGQPNVRIQQGGQACFECLRRGLPVLWPTGALN